MTFLEQLQSHGLELTKKAVNSLQVNVGLTCDLACSHCHHEAGPERSEMMGRATVEEVIACAARFSFDSIDISGGAPELLPDLPRLVSGLAAQTPKLVIRTNLVALAGPSAQHLLDLYRRHRVVMVASLPASTALETDEVRGEGVYAQSIRMLQQLNTIGYGAAGSGLELNIAANPAGTLLPDAQCLTQERFRKELLSKHGITFNSLFTLANVPLGRFRSWLLVSGKLSSYLMQLKERFNSCTVSGLMCISQVSVNWDGFIYDCDFNIAAGLPHNGTKRHISSLDKLPQQGTPIPVGEHCFACTAGYGSTCGGSIAA